jgi:hypothetical protein
MGTQTAEPSQRDFAAVVPRKQTELRTETLDTKRNTVGNNVRLALSATWFYVAGDVQPVSWFN